MFRGAQGLLWEEYCRCRKLFLLALLVLAGSAVVVRLAARLGDGISVGHYAFFTGATVVAFIAYLPFSESSRNDIRAGVPTRRFLLPAGNLTLVFWPLLFRLTMVAVIAAMARLPIHLLFDSAQPHLAFVCQMVALGAAVHMLAWSARLISNVLTAVGFFLLVVPGIPWTLRYYESTVIPSPARELLFPACALLAALCLTALSLRMLRSGGWSHWRTARAAEDGRASQARSARIARRPFRSTFSAQVWYELRTMGKRMTIILCCAACPVPALLAFMTVTPRLSAILDLGCMLLMLMALPAGLWVFGKQVASTRGNADFFMRTRPVDDSLLGWARLGAAAVTVVASFAIVVAALSLCYLLFDLWGLGLSLGEAEGSSFNDASTSWLVVLATLIAGWMAYTRSAFVVSVYMVLLVAVVLAKHVAGIWEVTIATPLLLCLIPACLSLLLCRPFAQGLRRGVVSARAVLALAAIWILGTTTATHILLPALSGLPPYFHGDNASVMRWLWGAALTLLALSPFATSALSVQRQRHR